MPRLVPGDPKGTSKLRHVAELVVSTRAKALLTFAARYRKSRGAARVFTKSTLNGSGWGCVYCIFHLVKAVSSVTGSDWLERHHQKRGPQAPALTGDSLALNGCNATIRCEKSLSE